MIKPEIARAIIKKQGTPIYIYQKEKIIQNYKNIKKAFTYPHKKILYAVKCNPNEEILKTIKRAGGYAHINTLKELYLVKKIGFKDNDVSFTSVGLDKKSLKILIKNKIQLNLDSIEEIEKFCKINPKGKFGIRVRPHGNFILPEGHTNFSKDTGIGIDSKDFDKIKTLCKKYKCKINGIHGHLASNILTTKPLVKFSDYLFEQAKKFQDIEYINFGGGFGVPNEKNKPFDFKTIGNYYSLLTKKLSVYHSKKIILKIEPGRSLVADAGDLYTTITNVKKVGNKKQIAIDAGFAEFPRPRIYGAYHEITLLEKKGRKETYDIRSNTAFTSDFLGLNRKLPSAKEGDILVIKKTGAYGRAMASGFPGKDLPKEVFI
ncbi:MAG: hypothetical protein PHT54_00210 [Candidatus Nanoarchaeia archaeon]|nr:hypothetical protein [Candidatus Nanoarchaeia archaeon]